MRLHGIGLCLVAAALLGGCAWRVEQPVPPRDAGSVEAPSPVPSAVPVATSTARSAPRRRGDDRPEVHVVRRGDTLFAIALDYGFDYRDLAAWNALSDPSRILVGQRLRLSPPAEGVTAAARRTEASPPRPKGSEVPVVRLETAPPPEPGTVIKPLAVTGAPEAETLGGEAKPAPGARSVPLLTEPRALTLPYSQQALERLSRPGAAPASGVAAAPASTTEAVDEEAVDWAWPVQGDLVYRYGDSGRLKGIGIGGKAGQPVSAAADGRVVYSGSGLRGYGRLLIVKHNEAYLSVYAHNQKLLVKEGERVRRGQKIAEMGDSDASRVLLHFEMRRFGKPVDPLAKLPAS